MTKILVLLAVMTIASVVAAACGDDGDPVSTPVSSVGPGISSGVGPGITVGVALITNLTGPLLINGQLHDENGRVRLCEVLAESFPPRCAGKYLVVEGLDLMTIGGLITEGSVTWSGQTVQVLGTVEGEVLTVAGAVR